MLEEVCEYVCDGVMVCIFIWWWGKGKEWPLCFQLQGQYRTAILEWTMKNRLSFALTKTCKPLALHSEAIYFSYCDLGVFVSVIWQDVIKEKYPTWCWSVFGSKTSE